ncbi:hypothetical protein JI721_14910 [Alicyclobacillus cycloheptanicus]|uniref:YesK-like protein n=1 Tax=Alicyclobacillus cycloheptanicus TaxID=1457 RepID=A0ABT9XD51_9BACL|nr:hypothetical protein [Alicyclobacillus cycloheptanicus]MDQ0188226.1 hypothetical protein [Alicyclobacillus cycloheptanicus]WDM00955.1 hypothetical protein JI721_14910 [Alicyclobacillus cycloheptanicus]
MGNHAGAILTFWFMVSLLALISSFGVGTALNMLFRRWWLSLVLYLAFTVYLLIAAARHMVVAEWVVYVVGWLGVVLSVVVVRSLKRNGYPLFTNGPR